MAVDPEVVRRLEQQASLIRQLQGALGGARVVWGRIDGTGTAAISGGDGFTLTDNGTGDYTITFDTAFSETPAVVVTTSSSGVGRLSAASTSAFSVLTFNPTTGAALDAQFHFIATGPA